jgi:DNA-binding PadR family transcriptional regulator
MRTNQPRTLTPLALAVLELLLERPMHPYEMHQTIRDRYTDNVVKVRAGSLYHMVERLHRAELIEPVETARTGRRPERTVYAITETGREEFRHNLRELVRHPATEYPVFGAAVQMLPKLDPGEAVELLERRALVRESQLAAGDQVLDGLRQRGLPRVNTIEVEYAQAMARAELAWIRQLAAEISSNALSWLPPDQPKEMDR